MVNKDWIRLKKTNFSIIKEHFGIPDIENLCIRRCLQRKVRSHGEEISLFRFPPIKT